MVKAIKHYISSILSNIILIIFSLSCVFPFVWMFYSSLKSSPEFNRSIIALPEKPIIQNYVDAFRISRMGTYFFNSIFNAAVSLVVVILISFTLGYFLARFQFRGRSFIYLFILFGMLIPIPSMMIPLFIQFKSLGIFDKWFTLIIPYVAYGLPFATFLVASYVRSVPEEIEEAAIIDGSGFLRRMFTIVMPLCTPILATVSILQFFRNWNEFPFALILVNSEKYKTVPLGLVNFSSQFSTNYPLKMASILLATLPIILIYLFFNKKIIEGMIAGAIKG
ncbi:MAG: carbohydrate ABC transporter permease [Eubacteriales bacterium]|nr:carbohydrate ABC transporter permease [Eubacteriales bacterium]